MSATWAVVNGITSPSLGRNIAACGANCAPTSSFGNVEAISPGAAYEDRQQQVDLRLTRLFKVGRANLRPSLDLSNILNAGSIYAANTGFGLAVARPVRDPGWAPRTDQRAVRVLTG